MTTDERFTGTVYLLLSHGNGAPGAANIYWSLVSTVDLGLAFIAQPDGKTASDEAEAERTATSRLRVHDFTVGDWRNMTDADASAIDARLQRYPLIPTSIGLAADAHRRGQIVRVASVV